MQKFLLGLITPLIEKYIKKLFHIIVDEFQEINQVRKDKKFLKELRKESDARERAKRIKHYIDRK